MFVAVFLQTMQVGVPQKLIILATTDMSTHLSKKCKLFGSETGIFYLSFLLWIWDGSS